MQSYSEVIAWIVAANIFVRCVILSEQGVQNVLIKIRRTEENLPVKACIREHSVLMLFKKVIIS